MKTKSTLRAMLGVALVAAFLGHAPTSKADVTLFASDAGTRQLYTLDPSTGAQTLVGDYGQVGIMGGLAYDSTDDILFGSNITTELLYRIDRTTGAATEVGPLGVSLVQALAFDPDGRHPLWRLRQRRQSIPLSDQHDDGCRDVRRRARPLHQRARVRSADARPLRIEHRGGRERRHD